MSGLSVKRRLGGRVRDLLPSVSFVILMAPEEAEDVSRETAKGGR